MLPFSTRQLRARLLADRDGNKRRPVAEVRFGVKLADPRTVTRALRQLAKGTTPLVSPIPGRSAVWVLATSEQGTGATTDAFATDTDRLIEAARRAMSRLGVSTVTAEDVHREVELDPALLPRGSASVATMLSDLARERIAGNGGRRNEVVWRSTRCHPTHLRPTSSGRCSTDSTGSWRGGYGFERRVKRICQRVLSGRAAGSRRWSSETFSRH